MCGRYAITLPPEAVRAFFRYVEQPNFPPRYNIAPTQPVPIVRCERTGQGPAERHFRLVRWGFIPGWVKDPKAYPLVINARVELLDRPSYRAALIRRRCLVIADGFYEWRRVPGPKGKPASMPFLLRRADGRPMGLAGLWEPWLGADGSEIETACIVTVPAHGVAAAIHERMPAVLEPDAFDRWLDEGVGADAALKCLDPPRGDVLEAVPIGPAVNRVANDGPEVQEPLRSEPIRPGPPRPEQIELPL